MRKQEAIKIMRIDKLDDTTVFIQNKYFNFSYTKIDSVIKNKYKGQYRYFGGLQCEFEENSEDFKNLENWLIEIAEKVLSF